MKGVRGCTELQGSEDWGGTLEGIAFLASINYGVMGLEVQKTIVSSAGLLVAQGVSSLLAGETNKHKQRRR